MPPGTTGASCWAEVGWNPSGTSTVSTTPVASSEPWFFTVKVVSWRLPWVGGSGACDAVTPRSTKGCRIGKDTVTASGHGSGTSWGVLEVTLTSTAAGPSA